LPRLLRVRGCLHPAREAVSRARRHPLRLPQSRRQPPTNASILPSTNRQGRKRPCPTASPKFSLLSRERATIRAIPRASWIPARWPRSRNFNPPMASMQAENWTPPRCRNLGLALTLRVWMLRNRLCPVVVRPSPQGPLRHRRSVVARPHQRQPHRRWVPPRALPRTQNPTKSSGNASEAGSLGSIARGTTISERVDASARSC
jgi:hypothetical protein